MGRMSVDNTVTVKVLIARIIIRIEEMKILSTIIMNTHMITTMTTTTITKVTPTTLTKKVQMSPMSKQLKRNYKLRSRQNQNRFHFNYKRISTNHTE